MKSLHETYQDGEIVALDTDGSLVLWDAKERKAYNCGETPEEFGLKNIRLEELARIGRA